MAETPGECGGRRLRTRTETGARSQALTRKAQSCEASPAGVRTGTGCLVSVPCGQLPDTCGAESPRALQLAGDGEQRTGATRRGGTAASPGQGSAEQSSQLGNEGVKALSWGGGGTRVLDGLYGSFRARERLLWPGGFSRQRKRLRSPRSPAPPSPSRAYVLNQQHQVHDHMSPGPPRM